MKLKVLYVPRAQLVPFERNPRTHSEEQVAQIAASISSYGWTNPVLIDEAKGIIAGHGRVLAAQLLGQATVPTIELRGLTESQKRAYVIADNKLALNAGWNEELLKLELQDLAAGGFQMDLTGFSKLELKGLIGPDTPEREGKTDPDAAPDPDLTHVVAREGDIWWLGRHRLGVGDATSLGDVQRLLGHEQADLVWTDPPYNVAYTSKDGKSIQGDDQSPELFGRMLLASFLNCHKLMRPGACIYVAHADTERAAFTTRFLQAGFKLAQVLIWVKHSATLSRQDYNWQHEPILYGWKEGAGHYFAGNYTLTTVIDDDLDLKRLTKDQALALLKEVRAALPSTVQRCDRPAKSDLHPTMKPVALVQRMIEASTVEGAIVLDPFAGSGTTAIAGEKTNRVCRLLELDPQYADVIIKRWQDFTGKQATCQGLAFDEVATARVLHNKGAVTDVPAAQENA